MRRQIVKRSRKKPSHYKQIKFQRKRLIAKRIVEGQPLKAIAIDEGISYSMVCKIYRDFVIIHLTERYPDQLNLPLMNGNRYVF
jgi:FixJ family two-component response regulator